VKPVIIIAIVVVFLFIPPIVNAEQIGVQTGSWVKYKVDLNVDADSDLLRNLTTATFLKSFAGDDVNGVEDIDWIKVEIIEVSDSSARLQTSISVLENERVIDTFWTDGVSDKMYDFIIPINLQVGDILGSGEFGTTRVIDITTKKYDGQSREVYELKSTTSSSKDGYVSETDITRFHDKSTGILLELNAKIMSINAVVGAANVEIILQSIENSSSESQSPILEANSIPDWVKNIFLWYGQDKVSEDELLDAIKYLINEGILVVD